MNIKALCKFGKNCETEDFIKHWKSSLYNSYHVFQSLDNHNTHHVNILHDWTKLNTKISQVIPKIIKTFHPRGFNRRSQG